MIRNQRPFKRKHEQEIRIPKITVLGIAGSDLTLEVVSEPHPRDCRRRLEGFKFFFSDPVFIHQLVELAAADTGCPGGFADLAFMAGQNIF